MLHFRNQGRLRRDRLTFGRAAFGCASAVAVAILTGGGTGPAILAQSQGESAAVIGYATSDQLMTLQAREAVSAGGDGVVQRRRVAPRPPFPGTSRRGGEAEAQAAFLNELTASEPATLLQSFVGANFAQTGSLPPDPSGAAGPAQFILAANGRIRSFSKATATADQVLNLTTNAFFTPVRAGANTFGPKVKYDRLAGRWFIIAATDAVPGRIVIASSNASTITAGTLWSFFAFDNTGFPGAATCAVDSPTFGLDPYALYIGVVQFCDPGGVYMGTSGFVVRKTSVIDFATIAVTAFHNLTGTSTGAGPFAPQGVDIEDASIGTGFFIGVDNASFSNLMLRRVSNPGGTPTISANIPIAVSADRRTNHRAAPREPGWRERSARRRRRSIDVRKSRERPALDGARDWRHAYRRGKRFRQPRRRAMVRNRLADDDAGGDADRDAVLERRRRQLRSAQLLGSVDSDLHDRPFDHRFQRRRAPASSSMLASPSDSRPTAPARFGPRSSYRIGGRV